MPKKKDPLPIGFIAGRLEVIGRATDDPVRGSSRSKVRCLGCGATFVRTDRVVRENKDGCNRCRKKRRVIDMANRSRGGAANASIRRWHREVLDAS